MPKQPTPWKRGETGAWYAQVNRKQVWLAPAGASKAEAQKALTAALAARDAGEPRPAAVAGLTFEDAAKLFLAHAVDAVGRGELAEVTLAGYCRHLEPAVKAFGARPVAALKPHHVSAWLDKHPGWGPTTRNNAVTAVKRCLSWGRQAGHFRDDPLASLPKPAARRREVVLSAGQVAAVVVAVPDAPFRDLLAALVLTGCRPGEAYRLTTDKVDLDAGTWTVVNKTRSKTREPWRTVYLNDAALELTRRLVTQHPEGHVFRNRLGNPWTRHAVALRMGRVARKLGIGAGACVYGLRHLFITDALEKGVPPATVAELVGHKDLTMILRVYSRLSGRTEHLRDAARLIRPAG